MKWTINYSKDARRFFKKEDIHAKVTEELRKFLTKTRGENINIDVKKLKGERNIRRKQPLLMNPKNPLSPEYMFDIQTTQKALRFPLPQWPRVQQLLNIKGDKTLRAFLHEATENAERLIYAPNAEKILAIIKDNLLRQIQDINLKKMS